MDTCSIFLILHIFSCCSSVFENARQSWREKKKKHKRFSVSGLCFMQIGKMTKRFGCGMLAFFLFFGNFYGYALALGTNPISIVRLA